MFGIYLLQQKKEAFTTVLRTFHHKTELWVFLPKVNRAGLCNRAFDYAREREHCLTLHQWVGVLFVALKRPNLMKNIDVGRSNIVTSISSSLYATA